MPDAKKISELPAFSTVAANDILPIVDENLTGTGHCKASQISLLGGGPPGDSTVLERHMTYGAVTAPHAGFVARERVIVSAVDSQQGTPNGSNYRGKEIPCTNYVQGLFGASNATDALQYLGGLQSTVNPYFQGQAKFDDGSAGVPSITNVDDLATGIFFPVDSTIGFSADGVEIARLSAEGLRTVGAGYYNLLPSVGARAWGVLNSTQGTTLNLPRAGDLAARVPYGNTTLWPTALANNAATQAKYIAIEQARGYAVNPANLFNQENFNVGTSTRTNYTTPGDNQLWSWNGSNWVLIPAATSAGGWLGSARLTSSGSAGVLRGQNIASVEQKAGPSTKVHFLEPMPTADYSVIAMPLTVNQNLPPRYTCSMNKTINSVELITFSGAVNGAGGGVPVANPALSFAVFC